MQFDWAEMPPAQGYPVAFGTAQQWVSGLEEAQAQPLDQELKRFERPSW